MKKKIIAFGASSSKQSINKQFSIYAAQQVQDVDIITLDLNDFELPIFSVDKEAEGIPPLATQLNDIIQSADAYIISFAEHNGAYTAAYKNVYDWISRINKNVWNNKPMLLLSTSPGGMGASLVLDMARKTYQHTNLNAVLSFSLPSFNNNFDDEKGILDEKLKNNFNIALNQFTAALQQ